MKSEIEIVDGVIRRMSADKIETDLARDINGSVVSPLSEKACAWCLVGAFIAEMPEQFMTEVDYINLHSNDNYMDYLYETTDNIPLIKKFEETIIEKADLDRTCWNRRPTEIIWIYNDDSSHAEVLKMLDHLKNDLMKESD